jgi:hypothetical protein
LSLLKNINLTEIITRSHIWFVYLEEGGISKYNRGVNLLKVYGMHLWHHHRDPATWNINICCKIVKILVYHAKIKRSQTSIFSDHKNTDCFCALKVRLDLGRKSWGYQQGLHDDSVMYCIMGIWDQYYAKQRGIRAWVNCGKKDLNSFLLYMCL